MMRIITAIVLIAFAFPAHSEKRTFEQGFAKKWTEYDNAQYLFTWSDEDIATIRRALAHLEEEHFQDQDRFDNFYMGRRARVLQMLDRGGEQVFIADFERGWIKKHQFLLSIPENELVGMAVSRDRYCRPEEQDIEDMLEAGAYCAWYNKAAIDLYVAIDAVKQIGPAFSK